MKKIITIHFCLLILVGYHVSAQEKPATEKYGNTLNLGVGDAYNGNVDYLALGISANYEFDVCKNFTIAPFISAYTIQNQNYIYRETVIPVGIKGSYYFDQLLCANPKWDFYVAASVGFSYRNVVWESGYTNSHDNATHLYLALHIGAEYHLTSKAGLFLDLSSNISTFGLAVHF